MAHLTGANPCLTACGWPLRYESRRAIWICVCSSCLMRSQPGCAGKTVEGYNIQQMLEILTAQNVPVKLCKTCTDGRGISTLPLIDGVEIGTLVELAQWTLSADKVLTF